jgi:membrane protein YqaA with SNARE-associated domain
VSDGASLWGLFLSAFVSATLFPGGSEAVLGALTALGHLNPWLLLGVATAGNTLGGMSTYLLGWMLARRRPPGHVSAPHQRTALRRMQRYGAPLLLLSWLPLVGDPLCFAAGWLRVNALYATLFIASGKALRYAAIVFVSARIAAG